MLDHSAAAAAERFPAPHYAELHCLSNFSFQRGASSADELFGRAQALGYDALAVTDECSLAGAVCALRASEETGVRQIVGSEFVLADGPKLVLLCEDATGYAALSRLITTGRRAAAKGGYRLTRADVEALPVDGLLALWIPRSPDTWDEELAWISQLFVGAALAATAASRTPSPPNPSGPRAQPSGVRSGASQWLASTRPHPLEGEGLTAVAAEAAPTSAEPRLWIAVELHREAGDDARLAALQALSRRSGVPLTASGDAHMHLRRRRALQDALTAIRLGRPVADCGYALFANGERHLHRREELAELYPQALLQESVRIAARCRFSLREVSYRYPKELVPDARTPTAHLRALTEAGAATRWPTGVPADARALIEKELALIAKLRYEAFFLTVEDIVRWARGRGILCQGRGSAANSVVCYCLGITAVGPDRIVMLFERFVSEERDEPPDIDVDFEHERREEVIQYVYGKYGRERAALAATVIRYRHRSAARDLGRALGFGEDRLDQLSRAFSWAHGDVPVETRLQEAGFDPQAPEMRRFVRLLEELVDFPRHLSQHVGGFVISDQPLWELVPVENATMADRTVIQWDKDDLETLGLLKVDCLALGMLTCLRRCFDLVQRHHGEALTLAGVREGDAATYDMIRRADTIGVFQIESRAQMSMLPRLRPEHYYDLVIQVAIVRPGPIQGGMVHPYLRRRSGEEDVTYPSDAVRGVLGRTFGVPIFQEQVMALLQVAADFTPGEADRLRRAMAAWKRKGGLEPFRERIFEGLARNGYSQDYAERIFEQIKGFGSYGFPESHAASFALLAYVSSYLKCRYPAAFACALLNAQPMGFYAPAQLVADARRHGVRVLPPDVVASDWDCTLVEAGNLESESGNRKAEHGESPRPALRLGLRLVNGLAEDAVAAIVAARAQRPLRDVADLVVRAGLDERARNALARAGALRRLAGHRHRAQWAIAGSSARRDLLLDAHAPETRIALRPPTAAEDTFADYAGIGLTLQRHPAALVRRQLAARRVRCADQLPGLADGTPVRCAGLVTIRQRPGTASGITFVTIEDETGSVNVVVRRELAVRQRRELLDAVLLAVDGVLENRSGVRHLLARRLVDYSPLLAGLHAQARNFH